MRKSYWSSSRLAKYLQEKFAIKKPRSTTRDGWRIWRKACKEKNEFIYWLTEDFFDDVQDIIYYPAKKLSDLRYALKARFFTKHYMMDTKLNRWGYHEIDTRILHGLFETLVDYIEIEKAWMMVYCHDKSEYEKFGFKWYETNWYTNWFFDKRHPEAGLEYLKWEMSLVIDDAYLGHCEDQIEKAKADGVYGELTHQGKAAKEQMELYHWWKNVRPKRIDPYDASGFQEFWNKREEALKKEIGEDADELDVLDRIGDITESQALKDERTQVFNKMHQLEKEYDEEDEQMLIRLIKIRQSLWT